MAANVENVLNELFLVVQLSRQHLRDMSDMRKMRNERAPHLSQSPGVLPPHEVELHRHGEHEGGQVGHRQVEQVDVGGGPHVLVPHDDQAGGQVTENTQQEK